MTQITPTVTLSIYVASSWVDISADWLADGNIFASWGMADNRHITRVASTGEITFLLNNATGKYSPNLATAMTGFVKGARVRLDIVYDGTTKRLHGRIADLDIDAGTTRNRRTRVTVLDWMEQAANYPMDDPTIGTNKRGDEVLTSTVALMPIAPLATSYDTGVNTFPTTLDINTKYDRAYGECAKIALSEMGYIYLKKDATNGETLVFEGAHYRHGLRTLKTFTVSGGTVTAAFANVMYDSDITHGDNLINQINVTAYPRIVAGSNEVLFSLGGWVQINPGQSIPLKGYYTNPTGGSNINGKTMVDPVATTDYLFNTASDGSGSNITADLAVVPHYYSNGFNHTLTNNNASTGYVIFFQCRGLGVYTDNIIETPVENSASITAYGAYPENINQKYQQVTSVGKEEAEKIIDEERLPRTVLNSISLWANVSNTFMQAFLNIDIGDLISVTEAQSGIDGYYYVQGVEFTIYPGKNILFKWILKQSYSLTSGLSLISTEFSDSGNDYIDCGLLPIIDNLGQRSDSFWLYINVDAGGPSSIFMCTGYGIFFISGGDLQLIVERTVSAGVWHGGGTVDLGQWYHVVITIDNSSAANNPIFYIDGSPVAVTEDISPSGSLMHQTDHTKRFGYYSEGITSGLMGAIKDYRVYNRILSAGEVSTLYNEGAGGTSVSSTGLLFQSPCVRTRDIDYFTAHTLTAGDRLIDNIYGAVGAPSGTIVTYPADVNLYTITPATLDTIMISSAPTGDYHSLEDLHIGKLVTSNYVGRTLLNFDLSSIPATDTCVSATLSIWLRTDNAAVAAVWDFYRVLRNWSSAACWNTYSAGNNWATAGGLGVGDVDSTVVGSSASIAADTAVDTEIQISLDPTIIQGLWDGTYNNYGLMVKSRDESASGDRWICYSSDHATVAFRPKLVILTQTP